MSLMADKLSYIENFNTMLFTNQITHNNIIKFYAKFSHIKDQVWPCSMYCSTKL